MHANKLLVLHVPAGGGHKAAARAIAEAAAVRGVAAEVIDALDLTPGWFKRAYVQMHLQSSEHAPAAYGFGYSALDHKAPIADRVRAVFDRAIGAELTRFVQRSGASAVIATHFFPMAVLGQARLRRELATPVIGVVTDYAAHAFWAESGVDRFCGPSGATMRDLARHGVPIDRLCGTGIPIRPAFGRIPQLVLPRAGQPLRALITSGGFGVGPLLDVLRSFARVPDMKLTVVCGDNADRVARATRLATELRLDAEVVGFEPNMPRRMAEAHVIVGKPGGLTVSESLAAGRPLVLVGACPGQETKNQSWLVERGAAYASSPLAVGATLALLNQHDELARIAEAARALATPNAAFNVVDVALTLSRSAPRMPLAA